MLRISFFLSAFIFTENCSYKFWGNLMGYKLCLLYPFYYFQSVLT